MVVNELEGREEFLRRSLADLEREHDAGDLADDDYIALKADYERRLGESPARPSGTPRRPLPTIAISSVFLVAVAIAAGFLVARSAGRRETGQTLSGNAQSEVVVTTTTLPADLGRCVDLEASDAIDCYGSYVTAHPDDPVGLTAFGVFAISAGIDSDSDELIAAGTNFLEDAVAADPGYVPARVQLATVYLRTGRTEEARAELEVLEGAVIPVDFVALVDVLREALDDSATTTVP
jgi:cytochrome c-type biogenesis protein CcmH/NrfG